MKKYDFDQVISRRNTDCAKWNRYPDEVLPLWVADMDFPSPPEVALAINERVSPSIFWLRGRRRTFD